MVMQRLLIPTDAGSNPVKGTKNNQGEKIVD